MPPPDAEPAMPPTLASLPLDDLLRVDVALEGAWSETVTTVWDRAGGFRGFEHAPLAHVSLRPALELYFPGHWIGIRCCLERDGFFVLDEERARAIVAWVEATVRDAAAPAAVRERPRGDPHPA